MSDDTRYGHLDYQLTKKESAYQTDAPEMTEWNPKTCFNFFMTVKKAETVSHVLIFSYYCQRQDSPSRCCFLCTNKNDNVDVDLPLKNQSKIGGWGVHVMFYFRKTLLKEKNDICN